ncbi:unnamed protein product, partial [Ixodes persulcatus]
PQKYSKFEKKKKTPETWNFFILHHCLCPCSISLSGIVIAAQEQFTKTPFCTVNMVLRFVFLHC